MERQGELYLQMVSLQRRPPPKFQKKSRSWFSHWYEKSIFFLKNSIFLLIGIALICLPSLLAVLLERTDLKMSNKELRSWCYAGSFCFVIIPGFGTPLFFPHLLGVEHGILGWIVVKTLVWFAIFPYGFAFNLVDISKPAFAIFWLLTIPYAVMFYRQLVRRARDAGLGKARVYVGVLPFLNIFVICSLLYGSKNKADKTNIPSTTK